ncbi:SDR family NAD(P)-dependent oxidoreductase [Parvularcula sp. LCG005]|uniref:SDR family NAD(P)-dependent oxidoreductase n=1 Tax=Parvularcula sp. LCG005 TaxID=3078805 RepID=UPI0029438448|nr:SDR family oxidoreductase [Parvularcula sp. LCG005]WOI53182.1 SDR family oxidoreductase [Parvularcula sp. LCG005]
MSSRIAIVTGAAHGIGLGCAKALQRAGWTVLMADKDEETLSAAAHGGGVAVPTDVSDEAAIIALVEKAVEMGPLGLIVSNAGLSEFGSLSDTSLDDWNRILGTNLTPAFLLAKHAEPHLKAATGSMVLIASTRAHMSEPDTHAYAATKGGLVALTHSLAISMGPDVRVNCVSPGWINVSGEELSDDAHEQHPAGRVGRPDDIADAVVYLATAPFVTGAELIVDGGMTRKMMYK